MVIIQNVHKQYKAFIDFAQCRDNYLLEIKLNLTICVTNLGTSFYAYLGKDLVEMNRLNSKFNGM